MMIDTSKISKTNVTEIKNISSTTTSTHVTSNETAVAKSKVCLSLILILIDLFSYWKAQF